ncbi:MAG: iron-containing alcohol dehydrogenase [Synergistaceae bacterium]|jgi:4-hydroxybutyrate dehydrogenase|nr:iron-containing alcohol dehydrogenase [Synergistaceae bacterium]
MGFFVKTNISESSSFDNFLQQWQVGSNDLIITNEYVLKPKLGEKSLPCDVLYQEIYGKGEPDDEMVDAMLKAVADKEAQGGKTYARIIAIGGGTVIDICKLFVFGGGLNCEEIFQKGATLPRKRQLLIVPTTCGTGSEVTSISIVAFKKKNTKMGLATSSLFPDEAVLIGDMLTTLPYEVFATSSIDALIHAVESYVSPKATVFTQTIGESAMTRILEGYQELVSKGWAKSKTLPKNLQSFLIASTMAGISFGNAGVGAVHALSYPIGAIYHVPHGKANYLVFEEVFTAYRRQNANFTALEGVLGKILGSSRSEVWRTLFELLSNVLSRQPLHELGIDEKKCLEMAESVIQGQQRLLVNNPVPLSQETIAGIYKSCM